MLPHASAMLFLFPKPLLTKPPGTGPTGTGSGTLYIPFGRLSRALFVPDKSLPTNTATQTTVEIIRLFTQGKTMGFPYWSPSRFFIAVTLSRSLPADNRRQNFPNWPSLSKKGWKCLFYYGIGKMQFTQKK